jgi:hypothetical protein
LATTPAWSAEGWSREIADGWTANGMLTTFWFPGQPSSPVTEQATLSFQREIGPQSDLFFEYIGDYQTHGVPTQMLNVGGAYRITKTQQIDFHIGAGLNSNSPSYFIGVGYSFRFDGLF